MTPEQEAKRIRPEFGNQEHINILRREQKQNEMIKKALEQTMVGTQSIESCGCCGAPTREFAEWLETEDGEYRICHECDRIIESK